LTGVKLSLVSLSHRILSIDPLISETRPSNRGLGELNVDDAGHEQVHDLLLSAPALGTVKDTTGFACGLVPV
jgi:hypothetical protein